MRHDVRALFLAALGLLAVASAGCPGPGPAHGGDAGTDAGTDAGSNPTSTSLALVSPGVSSQLCRVSNTKLGGANSLDTKFSMGAADQGASVDDPVNKVTWVFFGDTADAECEGSSDPKCVGDAWAGSNGANATGYLDGSRYGDPLGLCGSLKIVTQPGLKSSFTSGGQPGAVFSADVLTAPVGDAINQYQYHSPLPPGSLPNNSTVLPVLPARSAISGTNEGPSGVFAYNGSIYLFSMGSPGRNIGTDCSVGLPQKSISFLASWKSPTTSAPAGTTTSPTSYDILSRVDYNLGNFTYGGCLYTTASAPCALPSPLDVCSPPMSNPPAICSCSSTPGAANNPYSKYGVPAPAAPAGWPAAAPLGGHFIWVTPVVGGDGYLYLFGTGTFRASSIYAARLPLVQNGVQFPKFVTQYLGDTPGIEFYDSASATSWDPKPANATPLAFDAASDANASIGETSVRYLDSLGLWVMMYARPAGNGTGNTMVLRWASSVAGTWHELTALDMTSTTPVGQQNRSLYCCAGPNGRCSAPVNAADKSFINCSAGAAYAPHLFPDATNVKTTQANGTTVTSFTLSYLLSSFVPYDSVLFSFDLQATTTTTGK